MVFESIVADVVNRLLGDYVENLDVKQLKVGIWGGDVVLEKLSLKQSALDDLNLPIKLSCGHLGKLVLKIPWKNIYTYPVEATVEGLYLVVLPSQEVVYDVEKEEKYQKEVKQAALQKVEDAKKREAEKDQPKPDDTFVEKLITQIIKNVQIKIKNIHIRYEDKITTPGRPFALGLTLHHLSIHTTDKDWQEAIIKEAVDQFHKILSLEGLALYWNCNTDLYLSRSLTQIDVVSFCQEGIFKKGYNPPGFRYVFGPISSTVKLIMVPKPDSKHYNQPKYLINWELQNLSIGISKSQYHDLLGLLESFDRMSRGLPYRKYRPDLTSYCGHYKEWWRFAFKCILEEDVRRIRDNWKWSRMLKHRKRCQKYAAAYKVKLTAKRQTDDMAKELEDLEKHLDVLNIILVRQKVEVELDVMNRQLLEMKSKQGWFGGWWGGGAPVSEQALTPAAIAKKFEQAMTPDEKAKLYRAIDYEENAKTDEYPANFVELKVDFTLTVLDIEVRDDTYDLPRVLYTELKTVCTTIERRPTVNGLKVCAKVTQFTVYGMQQGSHVPKLVISKELKGGIDLLDVLYETEPEDKGCDTRVNITSRPLEIIYDARTINKVIDVFQPPTQSNALNQLQAAASSRLQNFKEMSALGLQYAIEKHDILDLNVDLKSSYIVIPHSGIYTRNEDLLVINLGNISMKSVARNPGTPNLRTLYNQGTSEVDIMKTMISQSYDKFDIQLQEMQVLVSFAGENWKQILHENKVSQLHLLTPTSLIVNLDKCVVTDDPRLPKIKIRAHLPKVAINVSDERVLHLLVLFTSIPLPNEDEVELRSYVDGGSQHSSISAVTRYDIPVDLMNVRDNKPWRKLATARKTGGEPPPIQAIELDIKFAMPDLTISLHTFGTDFSLRTATKLDETNKLLLFHLVKLEFKYIQKTYDVSIKMRLGGVSCDVCDDPEDIRLLDTPMTSGEEKYLFTVVYMKVDKKSPEFKTTHQSIQQYVSVRFTSLSVRVHQEALLSVMGFAQQFQSKLTLATISSKENIRSSAKPGITAPLPVISEESTEIPYGKQVQKKKKRYKKAETEEIIFKFEALLENLYLEVVNRRATLTKITIKGCYAEVNFTPVHTQVIARLQDILVLDLNNKTSHPKVVSILGQEVLNVEVLMFNEREMDPSVADTSADMSVTANISCIRVVYLSSFVTSLLRFLDSFQAAHTKLMEAAAGAANIAKQNIQGAKTLKIVLNIKFQAPIIIFPINKESMNAVILDFGKLTITNEFNKVPVNQKTTTLEAVIDEISLGLDALKITRVKLSRGYDAMLECALLEPVSFNLNVYRNLAPWYPDIADIRVNGKLDSMNISLTEEDFKMIMRVLAENFAEPYVVETPQDKAKSSDWSTSSKSVNKPKPSQPKKVQIVDFAKKDDSGEGDGLDLVKYASFKWSEADVEERMRKDKPKVPDALKFCFVIEYLFIDVLNGGIPVDEDLSTFIDEITIEDSKSSLARFSIQAMVATNTMMADGNLTLNLLIANCLLEDTRKGLAPGRLTRLMQMKDIPRLDSSGDTPRTSIDSTGSMDPEDENYRQKNMIEILYKQHYEDLQFDLSVYSFELILSMELLLQLAQFFASGMGGTPPSPKPPPKAASRASVKSSKPSMKSNKSSKQSMKSKASARAPHVDKNRTQKGLKKLPMSEAVMTVNIKLEKPDIVLVESMLDINTSSIIMNCELRLGIRVMGESMAFEGCIKELMFYSCCYNVKRRRETRALILHPCTLSVTGSNPDGEGLHLDLVVSAVRLGVSPGTIELLSKVYFAFCGSVILAEKADEIRDEYTDLWTQRPFDEDEYWFLRTEVGEDALLHLSEYGEEKKKVPVSEVCRLVAESIVITVEAGVGKQTLPMILMDSRLDCIAHNWSSEMILEGRLTLQMSYYNSRLALWEPLIEPIESYDNNKRVVNPWELIILVTMNKQASMTSAATSLDIDVEELVYVPPAMKIRLMSEKNLDIVITKTSMNVFTNLLSAFQTAVSGWNTKPEDEAPFVVKNDTGLDINIMLDGSQFKLFEVSEAGYSKIVLHSGSKIGLNLTEDFNEAAMLKALKYVGSDASIGSQGHIKERYLHIEVQVGSTGTVINLPVVRADKRYFSLNYRGEDNEPWGLVSHVKVVGGSTILTLRSIVQIYNHFNEPVKVYYMTNSGNEVECIGTVKPESEFNVPLKAIYTLTNELFFSVEDYTVSVKPFVWKKLKNSLKLSELLQCEPKNPENKGHFYMKAFGDIEQIYHELSCRHTMNSTTYNVHLRPAIIMRNLLPVDLTVCLDGASRTKLVLAGEKVQLPTADPAVSKLTLTIPQYMENDWVCSQGIQWNAPPFAVCTFTAHAGQSKASLDLGIHTENKHGTAVMSLYCPFWMLNKTGVSLSYRSDDAANILHHPGDFKGPVLFSFKPKSFFGKKKAAVKIDDGDWSDKFSLDVAGSSGIVSCKIKGINQQLGVHIQLTHSTLTKQVTFTPFFVVINNTPLVLEVQEADRPADPWTRVLPSSCTALWPVTNDLDKVLRVRVAGTREISTPFSYTSPHTTLVKLTNSYGGINVDVQITEASVYVTFTPYMVGLAPAKIINHTSRSIDLWEKGADDSRRTLPPGEAVLFSWESTSGERKLNWSLDNQKEKEEELRKDAVGEFKLEPNVSAFWVSFLDGFQRVLLFTDDVTVAVRAQAAGELEPLEAEYTLSIHGIGLSLINNAIKTELLYIGIASSGVAWETCKSSSKRFKPVSSIDSMLIEHAFQIYQNQAKLEMDLPNSKVVINANLEVDFEKEMMLKPSLRRLRRKFIVGFWVQMKLSKHQLQLHAKINRLQVDNQMYDSVFPIVLAPVPPPKSVAASQFIKPFAELSIVRQIMDHSPIKQYKYFKFLLQEFHVKVDIGLINALVEFLETNEPTEADEAEQFKQDASLVNESLLAHVSLISSQEQKNFYDCLHLSPLKMHLSFSMVTAVNSQKQKQEAPLFLSVLMQSLGVTLTDVQDVVFKLAFYQRECIFLTQQELIAQAYSHYWSQALKQLYVLVLGLDVLGNPYGLVIGFTKGVEDLFYEPFQGAIQGPGEFAEGVVLGVRSLFGHTVGGAAGAASRITGAMGKGIAALTFDKDYQRKRREAMNQRPANVQIGLAQSGKGLVMGVVDGVSGVFTKPISGAKEDGVAGFFTGMGKGVLGLVTRPTAGVIDFASGSLDAVKRVTEMSDEVLRLRLPRFFHPDGFIRPYSAVDSAGNKLLQDLDKGRYISTDIYIYHLPIARDTLLLTDKRVMYISHNDIFGKQVSWGYTWTSLKKQPIEDANGIIIMPPDAKSKSFFSSAESGKLIPIKNVELKTWVLDKMKQLIEKQLHNM